jgi:hypothetical protein
LSAPLGIGRIARFVSVAGRVLFYVRFARAALGMARGAIGGRGR